MSQLMSIADDGARAMISVVSKMMQRGERGISEIQDQQERLEVEMGPDLFQTLPGEGRAA